MWGIEFVVCFILMLDISNVFGDNFDYKGLLGPQNWSKVYQQCSGKYQSPININDLEVEDKVFWTLSTEYFDAYPISGELHNNGHTVVVRLLYEDEVPIISGGPITDGDYYLMSQFHFHWGANNAEGSEDRLNNITFPAELHIVFRNAKYADFTTALSNGDGIMVLAFFFEIQNEDNKDYGELIELLGQVIEPETRAAFSKPPMLNQLIVNNLKDYYAYNGSLTTPPCAESVLWIDFITPIKISAKQIVPFRHLKSHDGLPLTHNFRPIQPINDRIIYKAIELNITSLPNETGRNGISKVSPSELHLLIIILCSSFALISVNHS